MAKIDNTNPMPALSAQERAELKASIARDGFLTPIVKSAGPFAKGLIIDGFHRTEIAKELKVKVPETLVPIKTEADFRLAQIDANVNRRHLNVVQRAKMAMMREPWERARAKERQHAGALGEINQSGRATEIAANAVGLKRNVYEEAKFVLTNAPSEIKKALEKGEISVHKAYTTAKRARGLDARSVLAKRVDQRISDELPSGKFGAIILAPLWRTQRMKSEKGRFLPNEIQTLDVRSIATRDGIVMLWVLGQWLREGFDILEGWDARVFSIVTQVLDEATGTDTLRDRTRFAILATFGKMPAASRKTNAIMGGSVASIPPDAYALMDELVPDSPGLTMFTETKRSGWDCWNPEVE